MHYLATAHSDLHFLLTSDSESTSRVIVQLLRELGYMKVSEANDGAMAMRAFANARTIGAPITFLITDCAMPLMDGLELMRTVRADEQLRAVPMLMVTADATREHILEAASAGADDYLVKPFNSDKLKQKIDLLLTKYATLT
ncbi:response regulator [Actimicrobium sp. CCI2.3]|uniref:response regulator n=1 Tax=Actimicrobium sp. CCI2.3 TaxID=3048616 RepID=UPI002AB5ADD1|nr:response regulator [Actimicrobium sp. CCI2.3]MDY7574377.1 response regulator [Actimicrobium sp. CCI2.3]MEB0024128.1 response regulator [Actimicrobium sp. CCI2.3]